MKQVSKQEFENYIMAAINGEISRIQLVKELETDYRTLNKRIQLLSIENPKLYAQFIEKHPYKPREITNINIRNIIYEFLTTGINMDELAAKHNLSLRTLRRKIDALGKSKDEKDIHLYELCKQFAYNKAHEKPNSEELLYEIAKLEREPEEEVKDDVEKRREFLLNIEKQYQELCMTMSKKQAAKQMGYTTNRLYKLQHELYCIEIERNTRMNSTSFKERIAVNPEELTLKKEASSKQDEKQTEQERE